jgi:hypothetical protein
MEGQSSNVRKEAAASEKLHSIITVIRQRMKERNISELEKIRDI